MRSCCPAQVAFSSFSMRMLSIMGLKADYLPPVKIGIPVRGVA